MTSAERPVGWLGSVVLSGKQERGEGDPREAARTGGKRKIAAFSSASIEITRTAYNQ